MKVPRIRLPLPVSNSLAPTIPSRSTSTSNSQLNQTISLRDGRVLGYAEYGCPTGFPLLYFHGFPSSRLEGWAIDDLAQRRGLRVIAPDRPGYGLSSFQPNRRITDFPADIRTLTDHLNLSRFAVLGGSGGGPYALACALTLPHEMLSAVGVLAGAPPWIAGRHHVSLTRRLLSLAATHSPGALTGAMNGGVGLSRWAVTTGPVTRWLDGWLEKQGGEGEGADADAELPIEQRREKILSILLEGFAQGAAGTVQEAELLSHDWGFRFEDVTYNRIQVWHGAKDVNAPIQMMRYMAERLPHCTLREFADDDHYKLGLRFEQILVELVPDAEIKRAGS